MLNPSGVRFGSAEIYSVIERRFANRVHDSLCVGQRRPTDQDETVMLFLLMKPGHRFDTALVGEIRQAIGRDLSKRHVPKHIFETPEIPVSLPPRTCTHRPLPIQSQKGTGLADRSCPSPDNYKHEESRASHQADRVRA